MFSRILSPKFSKSFGGKDKTSNKKFAKIIDHYLSKNQPVFLKKDIFKAKIKYQHRSLRVAIKYNQDKLIVIPLVLTDKNDKQYWYNMTRKSIKKLLDYRLSKVAEEIENKEFEAYTFGENSSPSTP